MVPWIEQVLLATRGTPIVDHDPPSVLEQRTPPATRAAFGRSSDQGLKRRDGHVRMAALAGC